MNKVILIGNLGTNPEATKLPSGTDVCNFRVATNEVWTDKKTGERIKKTEWHNIKAFRSIALLINKYFRKGDSICIEGKLSTSSWEKGGIKKYMTEIVVDNVEFTGLKKTSREDNFDQTNEGGSIKQVNNNGYDKSSFDDDKFEDLPF